jgi:hypothetical protein
MEDERIQNAKINKAEVTFTKSIPYKVYLLDYGSITGTSYHTHDYVQICFGSEIGLRCRNTVQTDM